MDVWVERPWFRWAVLGFFAVVYLLNRSPYLGWNDGLGFMADAAEGWSPYTNATSHFLYTNLLHLLLTTLSFLSPVLVATLFSIACALLALDGIQRMIRALTGPGWHTWLPVVAMGTAFTFWQQAEVVDVYAFNTLLYVYFLHFTLTDLQKRERKYWLPVSLILGLGLLTHIQHLLSIPIYLYYILTGTGLATTKRVVGITLTAALFGILFLPPVLAQTNTIPAIFFDNKFRQEVMGLDPLQLAKGMVMGIAMAAYNFHLFTLLILHGLWILWKHDKRLLGILALAALPYIAFAAKSGVPDNHVFYLLPYVALLVPLGYSLQSLKPHPAWSLPVALVLGPLLYAGVAWEASRLPYFDTYNHEKAYKGGTTHLLWPGKAWAKDPLPHARQLYEAGVPFDAVSEWNYRDAVRYLKARGDL